MLQCELNYKAMPNFKSFASVATDKMGGEYNIPAQDKLMKLPTGAEKKTAHSNW